MEPHFIRPVTGQVGLCCCPRNKGDVLLLLLYGVPWLDARGPHDDLPGRGGDGWTSSLVVRSMDVAFRLDSFLFG